MLRNFQQIARKVTKSLRNTKQPQKRYHNLNILRRNCHFEQTEENLMLNLQETLKNLINS